MNKGWNAVVLIFFLFLFSESKRLAANTRTISNISYHGLVEQKEEQEKKRSVIDPNEAPSVPKVGKFWIRLNHLKKWK